VHFAFEQFDATLPQLVAPIPSTGAFHKNTLPPVFLQNAPSDREISKVEVVFKGVITENSYTSTTKVVDVPKSQPSLNATRMRTITILTPVGIATGDYKISITFHLSNGIVKVVPPFAFTIFDGFSIRVIEVSPRELPSSSIVDGRTLKLHNRVKVLASNFPQNVQIEDVSAVLEISSPEIQVLSMRHVISCHALQPDCNRTLLEIAIGPVDSPGSGLGLIVSKIVVGKPSVPLVTASLDFTPPCNGDYDSFCQGMDLITNFKRLMDKPIVGCSAMYCFDPLLIPQPVLLGVSPTKGLASGGTSVTVKVKNLAAFSGSDLRLTIQSQLDSSLQINHRCGSGKVDIFSI
jgi:hypothetical protein